jgi:integrase/recombinase XerD
LSSQSQGNFAEVRAVGRVRAIPVAPYWEVLGCDGVLIPSVESYLQDFWARGMSSSSVESYARDLLRWFRFLWHSDRDWDRARFADARALKADAGSAPVTHPCSNDSKRHAPWLHQPPYDRQGRP